MKVKVKFRKLFATWSKCSLCCSENNI